MSQHSPTSAKPGNMEDGTSSSEVPQVSVIDKFQSIKESILASQKKIDEAVKEVSELIRIKELNLRNEDATVVIDKAVEISKLFQDNHQYKASLQILRWIADWSDQLDDSETKLTKINDIYREVYGNTYYLAKDGRIDEIKKMCLPILDLLKSKIKPIQANDLKHKTNVEVKCLLCIGWCHYFTKIYNKGLETGKRGESLMTEKYGNGYEKCKTYAGCYIFLGNIYHCMENYEEAKSHYKKCIELYKIATNIEESERKERIETATRLLQDVDKKQRPTSVMVMFNF